MRGWRLIIFAIVTVALVWLMRTSPPPRPLHPIRETTPSTDLGSDFDPTRCGSITGTVRWQGEVPTVDPIPLIQVLYPPPGTTQFPNPNAPRVSQGDRLADAVVFLTRVDTTRSKPWVSETTAVEVTRTGLVVRQGSAIGMFGVVPRGAAVEFVSRESAHHSIRGRDAAYFTQMVNSPDKPVRRELRHPGIVELSSGSGYYWLRAYLVVSDHPYVAVTGADGSFRFDQVPDGEFEIHVWKANWHVERKERDPEWPGPVRMYFRAPAEHRLTLKVNAGRDTAVTFTFSATDFDRK